MSTTRCSGTLYDLLGVKSTASDAEIKKGYHKMALKYHPDKAGADSADAFKRIQNANSVLSDPQQRALYDRVGSEGMRRLMSSGMGTEAAMVAADPLLMIAVALLFAIVFTLLLTFQCLLIRKVDHSSHMSWYTVFTPVWIMDVFIGVPVLMQVTKLRQNPRSILPIVVILSAIIGTGTVCEGLHTDTTTWGAHLVPVLLVLVVGTVLDVIQLHFPNFREAMTMAQHPDAPTLTVTSPLYIGHVFATILRNACWYAFIGLLAQKLDGHKSYTYYEVFAPLLLWRGLTLVVAVGRVLATPTGGGEMGLTLKQKLLAAAGTFVAQGLGVSFFVLIANKAQFGRPSIGVVLIMPLIVTILGLLSCLLMACVVRSRQDLFRDGGTAYSSPTHTPEDGQTPPRSPQAEYEPFGDAD